tara:strand:- start:955 stop:3336 length:2382 start_codon:yes stop_codon:yes gene_type:complete
MAVFSAIASAVTGWLITVGGGFLGSTLIGTAVATAAGWIVAGGLAIATANLMGVFDVPDLGPDPGVKIQVAPNTDNRIGVAFGKNFMSGPITDVAISNQNETMSYCIVLSEYVEGATYTVNQIFFNDAKLNFGTGANAHKVASYTDPNATTRNDWSDKIRIRVYAGSTNGADQIFPVVGGSTTSTAATNMMPHWKVFGPTHYTMENLVFAMIELDYDAENGLTGLGSMSFDVTNSIHNPGEVLQKYLNNTQWGAGLSNTYIDTTSLLGTSNTSMKGYCDEQIPFTRNSAYGGATSFIDRWQINGYLNTADTVLDNIDRICKNSNTFFTFDGKQGKFKTVPNREIPANEQANAFVLNDDNVVSKLSVSSTELFSLYNSVKVEFQDQNRKDQMNSVVVNTPASERNSGEPDNELTFRAALLNNNIHGAQLANINLNQSRYGMVVTLEGDFSTLQIDAGDVVKLTNSVYGFSNKLFWVMRSRENFTPEGMITCQLTLLEYNGEVYIEATVTETEEEDEGNGVPSLPPVKDPILPPSIFNNLFIGVPSKSVTGTGTSCSCTVFKQLPNVYSTIFVVSGTPDFSIGDVVTLSGSNLGGIDTIHDVTFTVDAVSSGSITNPVGNITGVANMYDPDKFGGRIGKSDVGNLSVGTQIEDQPASNVSMSNTAVVKDIFTPRELDFKLGLEGLEPGDYSFVASGSPIGAIPGSGTADFTFRGKVNLTDIQGVTTSEEFGVSKNNSGDIPETLMAVRKITISPDLSTGNVVLRGKNTMAPNSSGQIGYTGMKYDFVKINKGDIF